MVSPGGHVHGIDIVPGLVEMSRENLMKARTFVWGKGGQSTVLLVLLKASHPLHPTLPNPQHQNPLLQADGDLLQHHVVSLAPTSGWDGAKAHAPYDAIHVGAAAASVPRCVQFGR
jgi:protein-L-isoaspartate O-methyltransferase